MKVIKIRFYACLALFTVAPLYSDDTEIIITESAQIAQDVAQLVLACKKTKDAQLITELVKNLLTNTAQLTQTIIQKRKKKKLKRTLPLDTFSSQDIINEPVNDIINTILLQVYKRLDEITHNELSDMESL